MTVDLNTIIAIDNTINPNSKYYGKLIKWKYNRYAHHWSYGIGLSDEKIFIFNNNQNLEILKVNFPLFIVNLHKHRFDQDQVIERLKYALICILEKKMGFDEQKWNDEHFARLITTNKPISYRVERKNRKNNEYGKKINSYLENCNPDRYINISHSFMSIPKIWHNSRFWVLIFLAFICSFLYIWEIPIFLIFFILITIYIIINLLCEYNWSGFQNKTLWNWLELLIIPILLALGGFLLQNRVTQKQKIFDAQHRKQQALKDYFKSIQTIIRFSIKSSDINRRELEPIINFSSSVNNSSALVNRLSPEEIKMIESFTKIVFDEIDGNQKRQVVEFLYGLDLIKCNPSDCINTINLEGVDLTEADLSNLDLTYIAFKGVNLKDTNLSNTILEFANLQDATLENANFSLAKLNNAIMTNTNFGSDSEADNKWKKVAEITSQYSFYPDQVEPPEKDETQEKKCLRLQNKNNIVSSSQLKDENFEKEDFSQANLEKLDLSRANFEKANLSGASLRETYLEEANLKGTNLNGVDLEGAYLKGIKIDKDSREQLNEKSKLIISIFEKKGKEIDLTDKDLSFSNLTEIEINNKSSETMNWEKVNLINAKLICAKLNNVNILDSNLIGANMSGSEFKNTEFTESNLSSSILKETRFEKVNFSNANLFTADLSKAELINVNFKNTNLNSADLSGANLSNTHNLDRAELIGAFYDDNTEFPQNFDPKNAGMKNKDE